MFRTKCAKRSFLFGSTIIWREGSGIGPRLRERCASFCLKAKWQSPSSYFEAPRHSKSETAATEARCVWKRRFETFGQLVNEAF
jgi:hypothetical protein